MKKIFLIFFILIFIRFFSYRYWNVSLTNTIGFASVFFISLYSIIKIGVYKERLILKKHVLLLAFIPFLSYIPALLYHDQSLFESFTTSGPRNLIYLFFFMLFALNMKEKEMIKVFIILGILWVSIQIIQQFTYPTFWCAYSITEDIEVKNRNGIYRFAPLGREFGLLFTFYSIVQFIQTRKKIFFFAFIFGLVGIYLTVTRQIIAASIIAILYGLYKMRIFKSKMAIFFIITSFCIYSFSDVLFGSLAEQTNNDLTEENIRVYSYNFYGLFYNDGNILRILFGNGAPHIGTSYYNEMDKYQEMGLYRADIGIVGMFCTYGLFYVLAVLLFFYVIFKHRQYIDIYYQMLTIFIGLTSVMLWHFGNAYEHVVPMSCVYYLIELSYKRNKEKENVK